MSHREGRSESTNDVADEHAVIGSEYAAALEAEQRHQRRRDPMATSPLVEVGYDFWAGELDLLRVAPAPADARVGALVERFVDADDEGREKIRSALAMDDLYTVLAYARRGAIRAMREDDAEIAASALAALALVDSERVDWRDTLVALGLTSYALRGLSDDATSAVAEIRRLAVTRTAAMMDRFLDPSPADADLESWGYLPVETRFGWGVAQRGIAPYHPTIDLIEVALDLASVVEADAYRISSVSAGEDLPAVWLPAAAAGEAAATVEACRGVLIMNARLHPARHDRADAQQLTIFVVEAADGEDAHRMARWASGGRDASHASLACTHGALLVLLVARSFVAGVDAFETGDALRRFDGPIDEIVARRAHPGSEAAR